MASSKKKKKILTSSSFDERVEKSTDLDETPVEKTEVSKFVPPVQEAPIEEPPKNLEDIPVALPTAVANALVTAKALKTTVKYCGNRWFHLVKGKTVTASGDQISYLRSHGLVE